MHSTLAAHKHFSARRLSLTLFIVDVIGTVIYMVKASPNWAIPQERGLHSMTGEPYVWAGSVLPLVTGFALLNLLWGAMAAMVWLIAVWIDFAHH
jgi:hypothetical protein